MVMARLVHRDFSDEVANYGDVVNTRRPAEFTTMRKTDADSVTTQDAVTGLVQVPLDQHIYVSFTIKDGEASKSFQDLVDIFLTPAAMQIARSVDRVLTGQAHAFLANKVGRLMEMTGSNSQDFLLDGREKMNVNKAYPSGRNLVLAPQSETELLKTDLFISAERRGDDGSALREASLGRLMGFDCYMDQNVPALSKSATVDYVDGETIAVETIGQDTNINIAVDSTYIATAGEYMWFAGEGQPHEIEAQTDDATNTTSVNLVTGINKELAANTALTIFKTCDVAATYNAGYAKGIVVAGYTATKPPVVGQLLAFGTTAVARHVYTIIEVLMVGSDYTVWLDRPLDTTVTGGSSNAFPGPSGAFNFAFHRNALALVTRPLALPNTALGVRSSVGVYNDVAMRVSMQYNISSQGTIVTLDLLCGVALLDANLGCILLG